MSVCGSKPNISWPNAAQSKNVEDAICIKVHLYDANCIFDVFVSVYFIPNKTDAKLQTGEILQSSVHRF